PGNRVLDRTLGLEIVLTRLVDGLQRHAPDELLGRQALVVVQYEMDAVLRVAQENVGLAGELLRLRELRGLRVRPEARQRHLGGADRYLHLSPDHPAVAPADVLERALPAQLGLLGPHRGRRHTAGGQAQPGDPRAHCISPHGSHKVISPGFGHTRPLYRVNTRYSDSLNANVATSCSHGPPRRSS